MEKKKVGIVTLWDNNYGSALQVLATNEILNSFNFEGVIINQKETSFLGKLCQRIPFHFQRLIILIIHPRRFFSIFKTIKKLKHSNLVNNERINLYVKEHISFIEGTYSDLKKIGKDDLFIFFLSGSDQVWNYSLGVLNPINYLRFVPSNKRIGNAASIGVSISPPNRYLFKKYIKEFNMISVREKTAYDIIEKYAGLRTTLVVDPCLQLDSEKWRELYSDIDKRLFNGIKDYILLYFLDSIDEKVIRIIDFYAKKFNKKIIRISCDLNNEYDYICLNPNPSEFLALIDNASVVLTDSFHGTLFSLLFNKRFWSFRRNYVHGIDQSTRIISLLNELNLENRFNPSIEYIKKNDEIDYTFVNNILIEKRQIAKNYWQSVCAKF